MTREDKSNEIQTLKQNLEEANVFYIADSSTLNVAEVNDLRRLCFKNDVKLKVAKNTLVKKALESIEGANYEELYPVLSGPTSLMFSATANAPAKIIKEFRKKHDKPVLKAAFIDSDCFIGDEQVEALAALKSKEELVGEVIGLLQSPAKNVIAALQSGGSKLAGILKTLSERE